MAGLLGNSEQINSSHTGSQKRLMGITPGCVHQQSALVLAHSLSKRLGSLLHKDLSPTMLAWLSDIQLGAVLVEKLRNDDITLELGLADLTRDAASIDGEVAKVCQQLLCSVLAANEIEQLWGIVDESGPAVAVDEGRVSKQRRKEGNVGLHSTDTELNESSKNLPAGDLVGRAQACALDQHGIVVGGDDSTGKSVSTIKTDAITASGSVDFNLSSVRLELLRGVFCCDSALDCETSGGDPVLSQSKLLECGASGNLDLGGNDIDTGDLLGDCVLDLDTWVDLNEVVAVLLVDQELSCTGISVVDRLGQLDSIVQDGIAGCSREVLGRCDFNDFLVAALN